MCRVLAYLGEPLLLEDLLYRPDLSFVNQTHHAALLQRLNLAGCGVLAWDARSGAPDVPYEYRTTNLAIYDRNLRALSKKLRATALLAHLRGVAYSSRAIIGEQNLHPFLFERSRLALAHNGQLARFEELRYALLPYMLPDLVRQVRGSTDSEWFYALLLSQLADPYADMTAGEIARGVEASLRVIAKVRRELGIRAFSPMNLFLCDGNDLVAACFSFDWDQYSPDEAATTLRATPDPADFHPLDEKALRIWYTTGRSFGCHDGEWRMANAGGEATSCIVSSEPLTRDQTTWQSVPLQHMVYVQRSDAGPPSVKIVPLDVA
jgi:glutamine amidotransferase